MKIYETVDLAFAMMQIPEFDGWEVKNNTTIKKRDLQMDVFNLYLDYSKKNNLWQIFCNNHHWTALSNSTQKLNNIWMSYLLKQCKLISECPSAKHIKKL